MERHCDGGDASNDHEASSTVELLPDARQDWETKIVRTGLHKYVYLDDMDASTSPPVSYNERVTKENDRDDHEQAMDIDTNMDAPPVNGVAFGKFKAEPRHELPVVVKKIEDEPTLSDSKPNDLEAHADTDFVPEDDDANLTIDASDAKGRMTPASIKEEQHEIFTADEAPDEGETKHGIKDDSPVPWLAYGKVKAEPHFDVVKKKEEDIELADLGPPDDPQVNKDDVCERIVGDGDVDMDNPDPQGCMTPALNDVEQHEVPHAGHSSTEADEATSTDDKDASLIPWLAYGKFKAEPRPVVIIVKKIEEDIDLAHLGPPDHPRVEAADGEHISGDEGFDGGEFNGGEFNGGEVNGDEFNGDGDAATNNPASRGPSPAPLNEEQPEAHLNRPALVLANGNTVIQRIPKRRRVLMDAVVVPTLHEVFGGSVIRAEESNKEIDERLSKLQNPKVKKNEGLMFSYDTIRDRLRPIGFDPYPVELDMETREVMVSRKFLSMNYGGTMQLTFPEIGPKFQALHNYRNFMCLSLEYQSGAPQMPGAPGLWFSPIGELTSGGMSSSDPTVYTVLTRITDSPALWQYQGQYKLGGAMSFTKEEWASESAAVRLTWAQVLNVKPWGRPTVARVFLRKTYGKKYTEKQYDKVMAQKHIDVTPDEIGQAFLRGEESLGVYTMKCVGYNATFQRELAAKFPVWEPPPPKPKAGEKQKKVKKTPPGRKGAIKKEPRDTKVGQKRKRAAVEVSDDGSDSEDGEHDNEDKGEDGGRKEDDEESGEEEDRPFYQHGGTRSRPIDVA